MNRECIDYLNSPEYIELIYRQGTLVEKQLNEIKDYCITEINEKWAIVSIKTSLIPEATYQNIGYAALPQIYGLTNIESLNKAGVLAVREQPALGLYGSGTYIAIIDTGINYRHEAFINTDNTSKIELIWDQTKDRVYTNNEINEALNGADINIPQDDNGHGTYMAGIAAGNVDTANNFSGVAPFAKIIVVKLRQAKKYLRDFYRINDEVPAFSETDIMLAVQFITEYCEKKVIPVSYCIGLGELLGSHIGTSPLCDILDDEAERVGRCVSIATGNEGNNRLHFAGYGNEILPQKVEIYVGKREKGFTCELWSFAPEVYSVEIISPSGQKISRIPSRTGITSKFDFLFDNTELYVYYKQFASYSGQNLVAMRFKNPAPGIWTINVYGRDLYDSRYDIWIMNREFLSSETYFLNSDAYKTITNPANTAECIAVSAYNSRNNSLYINNGRGYTAYDVVKPDLCAPGVLLNAPRAAGKNGYTAVSGTSIATAFYGGIAALLQEFGIVKGKIPYMRTSEIKNISIAGCDTIPGLIYPNREWGNGTVNLYKSFESLSKE